MPNKIVNILIPNKRTEVADEMAENRNEKNNQDKEQRLPKLNNRNIRMFIVSGISQL
ncbi:MAG: hypothetical protein M3261_06295 [Thermoproteota archaeon]|nr:hypothetical protein [Thermoproteota archaeon]